MEGNTEGNGNQTIELIDLWKFISSGKPSFTRDEMVATAEYWFPAFLGPFGDPDEHQSVMWSWLQVAPFDWIDTLLDLYANPPEDPPTIPLSLVDPEKEDLQAINLLLYEWAEINPKSFLQKALRLLPNPQIRYLIIEHIWSYKLAEGLPYLESWAQNDAQLNEKERHALQEALKVFQTASMQAVRLYGPADLRVEEVPHPGAPGAGEVLLRVRSTGICGSDLHPYENGAMGDTLLGAPLILGHEFSGVIEAIGEGVSLPVGTRVAVDPAWTCGVCDECRRGHPNLCRQQRFCGLYPNNGSLCQWMLVPARFCHAVPDSLSDDEAALLEPLGVALHAVNLARIRVGDKVAVLGAGPIGLCLIQLAKLAGAGTVYVTEKLPWRLELAQKFGAVPLPEKIEVDVAIEAAWVTDSAQQAVEITRPGGVVVLVGIPLEDEITLKHSALRRKGLTLLMCRRMKHVYERTIPLVESGQIDLKGLITHRFPLTQVPEAFRMNAAYGDDVVKVMISSE